MVCIDKKTFKPGVDLNFFFFVFYIFTFLDPEGTDRLPLNCFHMMFIAHVKVDFTFFYICLCLHFVKVLLFMIFFQTTPKKNFF